MGSFRTSTTARMVACAIAIALAGGGLGPATGYTNLLVPLSFALAVLLSIVGLGLGTSDWTGQVIGLALFLPIVLWIYVMGLDCVLTFRPESAWLLAAAAPIPIAYVLLAPRSSRAERPTSRAAA